MIAVVLTGNLDDGTAGLAVVKKHRGTAVVQDPVEADYPGMPKSAIASVNVDHVLPLAEIAPLLVDLVDQPLPHHVDPPAKEDAMGIKEKLEQAEDPEGRGVPSALTCPECGGSLFERDEMELVHFRCRTGHAYSPESLLAKQTEMLEASVWAAVRALEENAALARRMARRMRGERKHSLAFESRYIKRAEEAERHADTLRKVLMEEPRTLMEEQEPSEVEG